MFAEIDNIRERACVNVKLHTEFITDWRQYFLIERNSQVMYIYIYACLCIYFFILIYYQKLIFFIRYLRRRQCHSYL